ncbi:MAG TPA: hypothetical protein PLT08_18370, partial [Anaerolineales bacterium]|nr:hypothetical protein [Anaerolineales bacterium]
LSLQRAERKERKFVCSFRNVMDCFCEFIFCAPAPNGLRYWLVGGTLTRSTGRKMFGTLIMLEKPTVPTSPVHALLGVVVKLHNY